MSVADLAKPAMASAEVLSQRLTAIMRVSKALENIQKIDDVLGSILDTLFEVFPQADRAFLMLGKYAASLEPLAVRQRNRAASETLSVSTSICRKALEMRSGFLFSDQNNADFDQALSIVSLKIRSAMTMPLIANEQILGLIQLDTADPKAAFTAPDLQLAMAVSQQAAIAVHNAQLVAKVIKDAATQQNLLRFLPGPVAQQVQDGKLDIALGGKNYHGTVLFSDVIGFTSMSETRPPHEVVQLMNKYFDRMVPCIASEDGAIDKFIGDAIMAFWGIPFDKGESAAHACHAALCMQNALIGFNSLQTDCDLPTLRMGIGLNSGDVVAGNIGSANQVGYTLLGDAVNTAARVERAASKSQVLISEATWEELKGRGYALRLPPLRVRNKAEPVQVFSLRGLSLIANELTMHLPVTCGSHQCTLVRRLADRTFIVIHPGTCDIAALPLISVAIERPGLDLGQPKVLQVLPTQQADGSLTRTQISLDEPTLKGLLNAEPPPCDLTWDQMVR